MWKIQMRIAFIAATLQWAIFFTSLYFNVFSHLALCSAVVWSMWSLFATAKAYSK